MNFYQKLADIIDEERVYQNEMMKAHTTFRVGGPADYFVCANCNAEIQNVIALCKEERVPYYILGEKRTLRNDVEVHSFLKTYCDSFHFANRHTTVC